MKILWWKHRWTYRNPHCRTCKDCGREEHEFAQQFKTKFTGQVRTYLRWEKIMGDVNKEASCYNPKEPDASVWIAEVAKARWG